MNESQWSTKDLVFLIDTLFQILLDQVRRLWMPDLMPLCRVLTPKSATSPQLCGTKPLILGIQWLTPASIHRQVEFLSWLFPMPTRLITAKPTSAPSPILLMVLPSLSTRLLHHSMFEVKFNVCFQPFNQLKLNLQDVGFFLFPIDQSKLFRYWDWHECHSGDTVWWFSCSGVYRVRWFIYQHRLVFRWLILLDFRGGFILRQCRILLEEQRYGVECWWC